MIDRDRLFDDLRQRVFARPRHAPTVDRIGVEVELIPVLEGSGAPLPIAARDGACSLALLRRFGAERGWIEEPGAGGVPRFQVPGEGWISFEPGGQLELSAFAVASASQLLDGMRRVLLPLTRFAANEGVTLLAVGIDPFNPLESVPLQLGGDRYTRMAAYLARRGPAGGRMMRQTAAFQVNLDFDAGGGTRWRVLNAATPYLLAIFANSPVYAARPTPHRSYRAHTWRELDPLRTGLFAGEDPLAEYFDFALRAPPMLRCANSGEDVSRFEEWLTDGDCGEREWREHLSTLFPEVRPKGYLELRCLDAVAPEWWAAPLAVVGGIVCEDHALRTADDLLETADERLLRRAGEVGLADASIATAARDLFEIGLDGARRLGPRFLDPLHLEEARAFFDRYTARGLAPADAAAPPLATSAA